MVSILLSANRELIIPPLPLPESDLLKEESYRLYEESYLLNDESLLRDESDRQKTPSFLSDKESDWRRCSFPVLRGESCPDNESALLLFLPGSLCGVCCANTLMLIDVISKMKASNPYCFFMSVVLRRQDRYMNYKF